MAGSGTKTLLASGARTADNDTADQVETGAIGVHVIIDVTAYTSGNIIPTIQGKDPASGKYYSVLVGSAIASTGTTVLKVYPGIEPVANGAANDVLPDIWRVSLNHADATSITYSVGAHLFR